MAAPSASSSKRKADASPPDSPPPSKAVKKDAPKALPVCPFGSACYRVNPQHDEEFAHPGGRSWNPTNKTPCRYGVKCVDVDAKHRNKFAHPPIPPPAAPRRAAAPFGGGGGGGDDDDDEDEDEEDEEMKSGLDDPDSQYNLLRPDPENYKSLLESVAGLPSDISNLVVDYCRFLDRSFTWLVKSDSQIEAAGDMKSKLGGLPYLLCNDSKPDWPVCSDCESLCSFFLQLRMSDLPSAAQPYFCLDNIPPERQLLQFFMCSECDSYEAYSPCSVVRILVVEPGHEHDVAKYEIPKNAPQILKQNTIVGWEKKPDEPHPEDYGRCVPSRDYDDVDDELEEKLHSGDKLAGWPCWVQGNETPNCSECKTEMEMVFQVASEDGLDFMFGDCGICHIFQCPVHRHILTNAWACS